MHNVMVDCETLAVTADAVIMSIGAVEFELGGEYRIGRTFYQSISIDSNLEQGRRIDESTVIWWMTETKSEAREVFTEPKVPLAVALADLALWFPSKDDTKIWSNGASFDIPMLEHAFRQCCIELPWQFYNSRCMRTYRVLPGADKVERPEPKVAHNALDDAVAQALYVQRIHRHLFEIKETA